jgi:peptide/nickel transport system permease protein
MDPSGSVDWSRGCCRTYLSNAQWYGIFPGLFIIVLILGLNMLGDGLRDALDPRGGKRPAMR